MVDVRVGAAALALACAAWSAAGGGAAASSITLPLTGAGAPGAGGVVPGTGFVVGARTAEPLPPGQPIDLGEISSGRTDAGAAASLIGVSRADGGPFDLLSLDLPLAYFGVAFDVEGFGADGRAVARDGVTGIAETLRLSGVTADDGAVTRRLAPAREDSREVGFQFLRNDEPRLEAPLRDLVSLEIDLVEPGAAPAGPLGAAPLLCDPVNIDRLAPVLRDSGFCAVAPRLDAGALVFDPPPGGLLSTVEARLEFGDRRDLAFVAIDAIEVAVAPIPLPSPIPLLGAALGTVGLMGGLRPRRAATAPAA